MTGSKSLLVHLKPPLGNLTAGQTGSARSAAPAVAFLLCCWIHPAQACAAIVDPADASACQTLEQHANTGTLAAITVPFDQPIPEQFEQLQPDLNLNAPAARVVLAGRSQPLYAFVQRYTDKNHPDLIYLDDKGARLPVVQADAVRHSVTPAGFDDLSLVRIGDRLYTLAGNDQGPLFLSRVQRDNMETLVCTVEKRKSRANLALSGEAKLCEATLTGNPPPPQFTRSYAAASRNYHGKVPEMYLEAGAAQIDIDNDGKPDLVARMTRKVKPLMSAGCSWTELAVLDDAGASIDTRRTSLLPRGGCDSERVVFRFEGQTFIKSSNLPRAAYVRADEVSRLANGKLETLCRVDHVPVFEVTAVPEQSVNGS
ncbi:MAG TPA: hypothetical protein VLX90_15630 [Steroidobacteraceae bacterium]|nr:hypothetical protein [Steroidobacteraceae bacterium]